MKASGLKFDLRWALGASLLAAAATPATAQTDEVPDAGRTEAEEQIGDIIVTAQRRSESLQRTPIAVTALPTEALEQRSIQTTYDLMKVAPGLQVSTETAGTGGGSATFFLRGLGQERSGAGSEPAVGIYIDDFYYPTVQGAIFSILDISQVEVLRGPQGTLFGRNTIGGAIRYTTAQPGNDFEGKVELTVGSFGRKDITGSVNVPLSPDIAVRLTAGRLDTNGYVKLTGGGKAAGAREVELVRGQIEVNPTSTLRINLSAEHSVQRLDGFPTVMPGPIVPKPDTLPFVWNLLNPDNPYDDRYASTCDYCQHGGTPEFSDTRSNSVYGVANWDVSDALTVKYLASWAEIDTVSDIDLDGSPLPIFGSSPAENDFTSTSHEVQLNGELFGGRLKFVSGLYYFRSRETLFTEFSNVLGNINIEPRSPNVQITKSRAAYVDATFELLPDFKLIGGIRFSEDEKDLTLFERVDGVDRSVGSNDSWASTTPRFGFQYQATPNAMVYVTASKGFRGGGFNKALVGGEIISFAPESLWSYEAGLRMELFDRRLRLNPTVFYADWTGVQIASVVLNSNGTISAALQNAGRAHISGFELEAEAAVTSNLRLFGNLATLDAQYDDVGNATEIRIDTPFQRAPKLTYSVGATHDFRVSEYRINTTVNWSWQGAQESAPSFIYSLRLPSYGLLNARVELTAPSERWALALFATNLLDKTYYVGGADYSVNVGALRYDIGRPQEFGASLRFKF